MRRSLAKYWLISCLALVLAPITLKAQTPRIDRVVVKTVGIYEATSSKPDVEEQGAAAGSKHQTLSYKFVKFGTSIPIRKHIRFGFQYVVEGVPSGAIVSLRQVTIFPAPGLHNPARGQTWARDDFMMKSKIGQIERTGYGIDDDWEMVPGTWTFQLWDGNRKLAEQSFQLKPL